MGPSDLDWVELIGYVASLLVVSTFCMKTMIPLRSAAVGSNVAFVTYGYLAGLAPVFVLHVVLLPINLLRLYQMHQLIARVRRASTGDDLIEWLVPFMTAQAFAPGAVLFRQGEAAELARLPPCGNGQWLGV
jgi:CRP/FNR family cyclic AMP-dependent transcriptional regulator